VGVPAISNLFSHFGPSAKIKLVIIDSEVSSPEAVINQLRSLNIEHVSPAGLMRQEISRRTPLGLAAERASRTGKTASDETTLALMRRWFWARKPDAGFALTGFPATLLQAKVFDEWLEARDESLNSVFVLGPSSGLSVVDHYRTLGLVIETDALVV
jgi:adenylate kinase